MYLRADGKSTGRRVFKSYVRDPSVKLLQAFGLALPRLAVGGLLFIAGVSKVGRGSELYHSLAALEILPFPAAKLVAVVLPVWEITVGLLLLLGLFERPAALFSALLFAAFLGALGWAWVGGRDLACGCFGSAGSSLSPGQHVVLDASALFLSLAALRIAFRKRSSGRPSTPQSPSPASSIS
jgi:uncharacterized membrane protein YphA (DoxX/SURF4 family)